jgi:hypothetical protein
MKAQPNARGNRFETLDLAEPIGAVRLMRLAFDAAQGVEAPLGEFRTQPGREGYPFRMLLTLLTYAYARGVFGSDEVELRTRTDSDFRYLAATDRPDAETLRLFRRREWVRLQTSLASLLQGSGDAIAMETLGTAVDVEGEAARRLEAAAACDSLALDW